MSLKSAVESLPKELRQRLIDLTGTTHDEHVCYEDGTDCQEFDALVEEFRGLHHCRHPGGFAREGRRICESCGRDVGASFA